MPITPTVRAELLESFKSPYYSHVVPFEYTNYIDGMFHVGMVLGAAYRIGDEDTLVECYKYCVDLDVRKARSLALHPLKDSWVSLGSNLWGHTKPQGFAGPAAIHWALPKYEWKHSKPTRTAWTLCVLAPVYALLCRWGPMRQHLNSVMLAHLLLNRRPPQRLMWAAKDNPVYQFIMGVTVQDVTYPNTGPWPAKDVPFGAKVEDKKYTPACQYVGEAVAMIQRREMYDPD